MTRVAVETNRSTECVPAAAVQTDRVDLKQTNKQEKKRTKTPSAKAGICCILTTHNIRVLLRVVVNRIYMFVCLFVFPVLLQICKILREKFCYIL